MALVTREGFARSRENALNTVEARFAYPVFVKPAGTGSSVGVAKAKDRAALEAAIEAALKYDRKVLVEEFISGQEVEGCRTRQRQSVRLHLRRN